MFSICYNEKTMSKHITWDEYFMALAKISALRSKDPRTKVGACLVDEDKIVIGLGYNGMPAGNDEQFPWSKNNSDVSKTKYPYVIHAEVNAILNSSKSTKNAILYTSLFPCSNCVKTIVQAKIKEIVYLTEDLTKEEDNNISKNILKWTNIKIRKMTSKEITITI